MMTGRCGQGAAAGGLAATSSLVTRVHSSSSEPTGAAESLLLHMSVSATTTGDRS